MASKFLLYKKTVCPTGIYVSLVRAIWRREYDVSMRLQQARVMASWIAKEPLGLRIYSAVSLYKLSGWSFF